MDGSSRAVDQSLGEMPHRGVVGVRLVNLQRGELRVVRGVDPFVAKVAAKLEDRPNPGDEEPFEVQLGAIRRDRSIP